jgi:hypothetical protein
MEQSWKRVYESKCVSRRRDARRLSNLVVAGALALSHGLIERSDDAMASLRLAVITITDQLGSVVALEGLEWAELIQAVDFAEVVGSASARSVG